MSSWRLHDRGSGGHWPRKRSDGPVVLDTPKRLISHSRRNAPTCAARLRGRSRRGVRGHARGLARVDQKLQWSSDNWASPDLQAAATAASTVPGRMAVRVLERGATVRERMGCARSRCSVTAFHVATGSRQVLRHALHQRRDEDEVVRRRRMAVCPAHRRIVESDDLAGAADCTNLHDALAGLGSLAPAFIRSAPPMPPGMPW